MFRLVKTYLLILLFISIRITAFSASISGKFSNAPAAGKIYLYQYFGNNYYKFDSITAKNGIFKYAPKQGIPRGFYQLGTEPNNSFMFIVGNEDISISGDWKNLKTVEIQNSRENAAFSNMINYNSQLASIESYVKNISGLKDQNPAEYEKTMSVIRKQYDSVAAANAAFKNSVMDDKSGLYFAKILKMFNLPENVTPEDFFTEEERKDPEYTRGDMMLNKVSYFFSRFGGQQEETYKKEAENLIKRFPEKSKNRQLMYMNIIQIFVQGQVQPPKFLTKGLAEEYGSDPKVKTFLAGIPKGELQEGDPAPDIVLSDLNGKQLSLSSLKGKIVLLDFWASWCGPCRMENPNVVAVYNKYKDKGFTIFSVSLDNSKDGWINAIKKDGLTWPNHVSDLKGWQSQGAALYGVRAIPATFLIDKDGNIIAKNLRGPMLEQKLSELIP